MAFSFPSAIPASIGGLLLPPGTPAGPGGTGGVASPGPGAGWEIFVLSDQDYSTVLCEVPDSVLLSFQCNKQLDDLSSGTVVLNQDDPWWHAVTLSNGNAPEEILDFECIWQVRQDGVPRYEFLGETVTETLVDSSEQRQATITGPGTMATLKWAMCAPYGFPNIVLKLDGIQDSFSEVDVNGNGVLDTNIWNAVSPSGSVFITPAGAAYPYPGGAGYALSSLYPSGSVTLNATAGTTLLGATPYDATDTLISAQVSPIGLNNTSGNYDPSTLDGSELTQFYVVSNANTNCFALIGLSGTAFYCKLGFADGSTSTKVLPIYDPGQHSYWQITEQAGSSGGSGTFYFWTSPDGANWTQQWQAVHPWDARNCSFYFSAAYDVANSQSAQLTNLNSNVTTPSSQGAIYLGTPIMAVWFDQWQRAQARGTIPFVTTTMGPSADSFGNLWTDTQNVQTVNGTDLYSFLQGCASVLNADYVMQPGFVLQVGQPTPTSISLGIQRQGQIVFREGRNCVSKQRVRMRSQIQNVIGAENQDGHEISATDNTSVAGWGQREAWYQTGAQVDPVSMVLAASAAAAANADEIESMTLQILPNLAGRTVFQNFDVGDWVGIERPDFSAVDAVRVVGIAVSVDANGNEVHELSLMTFVQWMEQQLTFVSNKLGGAFVNAPGLTPVAPSKYGTGQVPTYFDPAAQLRTLADVNTRGAQAAVAAPLVYNPATGQYQPAGATDPVSGNVLPVTVAGSSGTATITPGGIAVTNAAPASAPDGGGAQPPSTSVSTTPTGTVTVVNGTTRITTGVQGDGTVTIVETNGPAPAVPDTPILTAIPAGITVSWDGLLAGVAPLLDFAYVQVHTSAVNGFTPSSATLQAVLQTSGTVTISGLTPGTTYYAKLIAVNNSGNASAASTQASVAAGFVSATTISGLTASLIGNIGVLNPNPYFWGGDGTGWAGVNGTFSVVTGGLLPAGSPYTYAGKFVSSGAAGDMEESGGAFPVTPNQQYLVTAWVYTTGIADSASMSGEGTLSTSRRVTAGTAQQESARLSGRGTLSDRASVSPGYLPIDIGLEWTLNGSFVSASVGTTPVATGQWSSIFAVVTAPSSGVNFGYPRIGSANGGVTIYAQAILCLPQVPGGLIQTGTITATQIAAGTIVAGIVNGTLISGAQFQAYGSTGEILVYNDIPTAGNLVASVSAVSGVDLFTNHYKSGFTAYSTTDSSYAQLKAGDAITSAGVQLGTGLTQEGSPGLISTSVTPSGAARALTTTVQSPIVTSFQGFALTEWTSSFNDNSQAFAFPSMVSFVTAPGGSSGTVVRQDVGDWQFQQQGGGVLLTIDAVNQLLVAGYPLYGPSNGAAGAAVADLWHQLVPVNGWANAGGGLAQLQYMRMPTNEVWLIGVLNPASFTSITIATLPSGYRPVGAAVEDSFEFHTSTGAGSGCFLRIGTAGTVQAVNGAVGMGAVGINTRIPLDTIT